MSVGAPDLAATVLIASWNTRELLDACLRSVLAAAEETALEVIVYDNASEDGTPAWVRSRFPSVRLIEGDENLGFGAAINRAAARARAETWIVLNPDTVVEPGALAVLVRALEEEPQAAIVAPRLQNPDGTLQPSCSRRPRLGRELLRLLHLERLAPGVAYRMEAWPQRRREVDVAAGACLALRPGALGGEAPFDESFFMYSEEVDLCERLSRSGWKILWEPAARVVHHGAGSTAQVRETMFEELYRAKVRFFRKHDGPLAAAAYKGVLALASVLRLLASPLALLEGRRDRRRHLGLARSYGRLLLRLPGL